MVAPGGRQLIGDTTFRALLPPELCVMNNRHKLMCCCSVCTQMDFLHKALCGFRPRMLRRMDAAALPLVAESAEERQAAERAAEAHRSEIFPNGGSLLHAEKGDAALSMQCPPPAEAAVPGLTRLNCARGLCPRCGTFKRPAAEAEAGSDAPSVTFCCYETRCNCTVCGVLPRAARPVKVDGKELCPVCAAKPDGARKGKFRRRTELDRKTEEFQVFWNRFCLPHLKICRLHRWKFIALSKKNVGEVRAKTLQPGEIGTWRDFAEAWSMEHNMEVQSEHHNGVTISIEGVAVNYFPVGSDTLMLDFHSFLSDDKTQMANTVMCHMRMLFRKLMDEGILQAGGRVLGITDGCAKQHWSATALCFLTKVAHEFGITIDRAISAAGHGKSSVDALNGVDKGAVIKCLREGMLPLQKKQDKKDLNT